MFKVFDKRCSNCLMTKDRIVSPERAKQLLADINKNDSFFVCHHSSDKEKICCRGFFDKMKNTSDLLTTVIKYDLVEEVKLVEEKYISYKDQKHKR